MNYFQKAVHFHNPQDDFERPLVQNPLENYRSMGMKYLIRMQVGLDPETIGLRDSSIYDLDSRKTKF